MARNVGLGGGDADVALERLRRVSAYDTVTRLEARCLYANALLRESRSDAALREEARRMVGDLVAEFPENPVFRRFLENTPAAP